MNHRPRPYQGRALPLSYRGPFSKAGTMPQRPRAWQAALTGGSRLRFDGAMVEPVQPGATSLQARKAAQKAARLAAALRENLRKRKAWQQAQAAAGGADGRESVKPAG